MSVVPCFWVEPLPVVLRSLRRFRWSGTEPPCPLGWIHNAVVPLRDLPKLMESPGNHEPALHHSAAAGYPSPWPQACACGYVFTSEDQAQVNDDRYYAASAALGVAPTPSAERLLYQRGDGLPPGAMLRMGWLEPSYVGPDGMSLGVVLPSRILFPMDFPYGEERWTRTGVPPRIDLSPSINHIDHWHGYLRNGELVD